MPRSSLRQPIIAVCGAGRCDAALAACAEEVGRGIALAGAVLVCGGLGGLTVGILPGADTHDADPDVLVPIATGMGEARNVIIVHTADVVIAVGGEYGTLSEIALARKAGRAVVGLQTWALGQDAAGQPHVIVVATPAEAVAAALARCNGPRFTER